ncbi:MAG: hypothetical protein JWM80_6535, partial [Cyanobacteria bacterium RYN_339]|nr:hypothetical protein [Cyanobacteria bacterium RYN_339]
MLPERYEAVQPLGEGAFGMVYAAVLATRAVAVKVLAKAERPELAWQFGAEYRTLARLAHPAFPAAVELGQTPGGAPFYAMELVEGLAPVGPLPAAEVGAILAEVAEALAHMHGLGLVHGDLKPENLRVGPHVRVLDVGLAAPIGQAREAVAGTLEYLAPEVFRKAPVVPAADLYALGCLGYELLTGRPPFTGSPAELVRAHLTLAPALAETEAISRLVLALLAKDPADRPASAYHVLAALGRPVPADALSAPARSLDHQAFVGRDEARAAWADALAAPGPAGLYLAAQPGLGKTRTLDEL